MGWNTLLIMQIMLIIGMASGPSQARSLQIQGTAGYLSEWELSGVVTQTKAGDDTAFSGQLIWKHVGLCSVQGAPEKSGEVRLKISPQGRIDATLLVDDGRCTYSSKFSRSSSGYLDCAQAKGIPLSLSFQ
jgi:hypothetical protein